VTIWNELRAALAWKGPKEDFQLAAGAVPSLPATVPGEELHVHEDVHVATDGTPEQTESLRDAAQVIFDEGCRVGYRKGYEDGWNAKRELNRRYPA
jgi:hypothetical protein